MFTFCGKCGTPSRAGPSNRVFAALQPLEVDAELLDVGNSLPRRRRLCDLDRDLVHAGEAGGLQRIEAADAARGHVEQRPAARRRPARRRSRSASSASAPAESTTTLTPASSSGTRCSRTASCEAASMHRLRARREQRLASDDVGNAELARQRRAARAAGPRPASATISIPAAGGARAPGARWCRRRAMRRAWYLLQQYHCSPQGRLQCVSRF